MYLIYDTESTTFPNPNLPSTIKGQARVVQLAALLLADDFTELGCLVSLVKPDNWVISEGAQKVHGISLEQCAKEGRPMSELLTELIILANGAKYKVAHNIQFDDNMLDIEYENYTDVVGGLTQFHNHKHVCTMDLMTPVCKLPFASKRTFGKKYKWPKLEEAYTFLFNEPLQKAHDALCDVRACARIFKWLVANQLVPNMIYGIKQLDESNSVA